MSANQYKPRPADKEYMAANGHLMVVSPTWSNHSGWHMVYAFASHSDNCHCMTAEDGGYSVGEYAGEGE